MVESTKMEKSYSRKSFFLKKKLTFLYLGEYIDIYKQKNQEFEKTAKFKTTS